MRTKKYTYLVVIILLLTASCKTLDNNLSKNIRLSGIPYDKAWHKTLVKSKEEAKASWLDFIDNDLTFMENWGISLTEEDVAKMEFYPVETYLIDSVSFRNFNNQTPLNSSVSIQKNTAYFYALKDDKLIIGIKTIYLNNKWEMISGGGVETPVAEKLAEILFVEHMPFFIIGIQTMASVNHYKHYIVLVNKKGEVQNFDLFGNYRPFKDVLLEFHERCYPEN